jgi:hypothetical protein
LRRIRVTGGHALLLCCLRGRWGFGLLRKRGRNGNGRYKNDGEWKAIHSAPNLVLPPDDLQCRYAPNHSIGSFPAATLGGVRYQTNPYSGFQIIMRFG